MDMRNLLGRVVIGSAIGLALSIPAQAGAAEIDCTSGCPLPGITLGASGAFIATTASASTGTGVIDSFVRLKDSGQGGTAVEEGHNTGFRPLDNDENNSPQFTRNLQVGNIPLININ